MRSSLKLAFAAALLLPACGLSTTAAAVVNGDQIDAEQFQRQLDFLLADPRLQQEVPAEGGEEQRQEFTRQFLTFLIHQQLLHEYADDNGIEVPQDEVRQQLEQQIESLGGEEQFEAQLANAQATRADVEALIREQVLRQQVAEEIASQAVTEEQLRETYEERRAEFTTAEVSHILVQTRAEAERIAAQATADNFARLARRFSQDPGSAGRGGDLGRQPLGGLVGPFAEAVLETPEGEVGGPVQTQFGWHVVLVRSLDAEPFDVVRDRLLEETRGRAFTEWLQERVREAEIRVNPRYGLFDEQSGQVVPRTQTSPSPAPTVQVVP
ncbi:MAG TPA: peptidylprolyl isomerase [Actinomycetota bacterium]|nr:peptidylprolyl isomerase [Actinomycetota bacterium]